MAQTRVNGFRGQLGDSNGQWRAATPDTLPHAPASRRSLLGWKRSQRIVQRDKRQLRTKQFRDGNPSQSACQIRHVQAAALLERAPANKFSKDRAASDRDSTT